MSTVNMKTIHIITMLIGWMCGKLVNFKEIVIYINTTYVFITRQACRNDVATEIYPVYSNYSITQFAVALAKRYVLYLKLLSAQRFILFNFLQ